MNTQLYLGFDPGGAEAFGWCLVKGNKRPLTILGRGIANHAKEAVDQALKAAQKVKMKVSAAGIDAPLFWRADGDRMVDDVLRKMVKQCGGHNGTVNHVNSLQGACSVQGMLTAILLRKKHPKLKLSESHPKAMCWILKSQSAARLSLEDFGEYFIGNVNSASDHKRDAALGALSAWAMINEKKGGHWHDLYPKEKAKENGPISPLDPPPEYWMPIVLPQE